MGAPAGGLDEALGLGGAIGIGVVGDSNVRTLASKQLGDCLADTGIGSGHDRDLTL